ncbi:MAG: transposase [Proteobacteria bacterium]|nr:MAG: transposase [Pseudomonadota bacterium]
MLLQQGIIHVARTPGTSEQNEKNRRKAIAIIEGGATQAEAAKQVKVILRTVQRWWKLYRDYGDEGLKSTKATGRPRRLSEKDSEELGKILMKGSTKAGFPRELWISKRVLTVIKSKFDVHYHPNHMPRLLRSLGLQPNVRSEMLPKKERSK